MADAKPNPDTPPTDAPTTESDTVAVHTLDDSPITTDPSKKGKLMKILGVVLVVVLGISTGYAIAGQTGSSFIPGISPSTGESGSGQPAEVVGSGCDKNDTFTDEATGELAANDQSVVKEGTHILIRPGGDDQTAYLFSSVMDLDPFIGLQVTVKGETFSAQKAGWLMDVGCVETQ